MVQYIEFQTEGGNIQVEVQNFSLTKRQSGGFEDVGIKEVVEKGTKTVIAKFDDMMDIVEYHIQGLTKKIQSMTDLPDEVELQFHLTTSGKAGNFAIAEVGIEAGYTVTIKWKHS